MIATDPGGVQGTGHSAAQPQLGYSRAVTFDWMIAPGPDRARGAKQRRAMYRTEISERAAMLCRLNYSEEEAKARLCANVEWDFEIAEGERPANLSDDEIARIVKSSFARRSS